MSFAEEKAAREARLQAFNAVRPILDKAKRGDRLSRAEQLALTEAHAKVLARNLEIMEERASRETQTAVVAKMGGLPSQEMPYDAESRAFSKYVRSGAIAPEMRAAGEGTGSTGGFLVPPGWWQRLQVALKAYGGTAADFELVESDTGQPMQWASNDPTGVVGSLIGENTQISDQDYTFGQGQMSAYMFTSGVQKVSFQLAQDSAFDIDGFIQARVAEGLGRAEAQYSISGTGSDQPLGIVTALNAATGLTSGGVYTLGAGNKVQVIGSGTSITSGTSVVTEQAAGTLNPSSFTQVVKAVDPSYRAMGAKWYMSDGFLQSSRLIADNFGRPFYQSLQGDQPTLLGYPVVVDNNIPELAVSASSGCLFGHMNSAMVLRRVRGGALSRSTIDASSGILKLDQRYADFLQVGYIGYERIDMRSNDLRAAVVVKGAAS